VCRRVRVRTQVFRPGASTGAAVPSQPVNRCGRSADSRERACPGRSTPARVHPLLRGYSLFLLPSVAAALPRASTPALTDCLGHGDAPPPSLTAGHRPEEAAPPPPSAAAPAPAAAVDGDAGVAGRDGAETLAERDGAETLAEVLEWLIGLADADADEVRPRTHRLDGYRRSAAAHASNGWL
jgi:hypothetical protein